MNTIEAFNSHYCCRAFAPAKVSEQKIYQIFGAAMRTPSWDNTQPWEIHVAAGDPLKRLREAYLANHQQKVAAYIYRHGLYC